MATFKIESPKAGEYRWVLTERGKTLASSPSYSRKASCQNAIASFRKGAAGAAVVDKDALPAAVTAVKAAQTAKRAARKTVAAGTRAVGQAEKTAKRAGRRAAGTVKQAAKQANTARKRAAKG